MSVGVSRSLLTISFPPRALRSSTPRNDAPGSSGSSSATATSVSDCRHQVQDPLGKSSTALTTWTSGYANRLMYGDAQGDGMSKVLSRCSVCCQGGCFVNLSSSTCPTGYTKVYGGRSGGVEAHAGNSDCGRTLCVDTGDTTYTWASAYTARLMRHRETSGNVDNGMNRVDNSCAMCCKQ